MEVIYQRPPENELAYHEATHAMICIELGVPFDYVMIDKIGDLEGHMCGQDLYFFEKTQLLT